MAPQGAGMFTPLRSVDLTVGDEIGKGRFKKVHRGVLRTHADKSVQDVVILRYCKTGEQREMEILSRLAELPGSRRFVPEIFGACPVRQELFVLQECAPFGSLKHVLTAAEPTWPAFTPKHRIFASVQVSRAMAFLESMQVVHADLSCRNCLLFQLETIAEATVVKVTDFGLALLIPEKAQHMILKQAQAVRWCAPETVARAKLSHRADAWSLGITLWELFSGGCSPWPFRDKRGDVATILRSLGDEGPEAGIDAANAALAASTPIAGTPSAGAPLPFLGMEHEFPQHGDCPKAVHEVVLACLRVVEEPGPHQQGRATAAAVDRAFCRLIEHLPDGAGRRDPQVARGCDGAASLTPTFAPQPRRLQPSSSTGTVTMQRLSKNPAILEFTEWAASRWGELCAMFDLDKSGFHTLSTDDFVELVWNKGFRGNAWAVVDELRLCEPPLKFQVMGDKEVHSKIITLSQFKRFQSRSATANAQLPPCEEGSVASTFVKFLKQQRGTVLRAWYMDLDQRGTGRIAYTDFAAGCRKLGAATQGRLVWDCLRKEGSTAPLEFHELAPDEAENVEEFAEVLLQVFGFDLDKAWQQMDEKRQNFMTLNDLHNAASRIDFKGNVKLLFRGLSSGGLGRMSFDDFAYVTKVTNCAPFGKAVANPLIELAKFVRREAMTPDKFIESMGIDEDQTSIAVNDLAARLTAVGFEGDPLQVAMRVARTSGGTRASVEQLRLAILGDRRSELNDLSSSIASLAPPGPMRLRARPLQPRSAWDSGVDNISDRNMTKCAPSRSYFTSTVRDDDIIFTS